jgi:hypothetical protein
MQVGHPERMRRGTQGIVAPDTHAMVVTLGQPAARLGRRWGSLLEVVGRRVKEPALRHRQQEGVIRPRRARQGAIRLNRAVVGTALQLPVVLDLLV